MLGLYVQPDDVGVVVDELLADDARVELPVATVVRAIVRLWSPVDAFQMTSQLAVIVMK